MRSLRPLALAAAAAVGLFVAAPPAGAAPAPEPPAPVTGLSARTVAQIDAIAATKRARTPVQRKVDSTLLSAAQLQRGRAVAAGVTTVRSGVKVTGGRATVDIHGAVTKALTARITALGGTIRSTEPKAGLVRADLPVTAAETLAAAPGVTRVAAAAGAATAGFTPTPKPLSKEAKEAQLRQRVGKALAAAKAQGRTRTAPNGVVTTLAGSVTSEGDVTHAADQARARYKVTGTGVTIGVLSDGVDSLAASVASGDLPPDTRVLPGQEGAGDEGTAMLEIVHDLAPGADLVFATAFESAAGFAQNIRDLRTAGADIIVDDVIYFAESPFQDGPIAQAVIDVTNNGALYFSSAGNEGNVTDGTSGNWEGDFVDSGVGVGKFAGVAHDFAPGEGVQVVDPVTPGSAGVPAILQWADPLGAASDDYDLYALDSAGNVVAFSNDVQDGNDDPFEGFIIPGTGGYTRLAVVKFSGEARYFQLTAFRGRFATDGDVVGYATPGVTRGHSAVPAAFSVAAVPAAEPLPFDLEPGDPPNPAGPYPGVYTRTQQSERFTSDGPRRVFFAPDGTPLTPGDFSSTGGQLRQKPDITAADGVKTSAPGFDPFFGTSASAPHAAAIAALVLSGNPGIAPSEVRSALTGTAIDIETPGVDRDTGYGIVRADRVLRQTGATPQPLVEADDAVVSTTTDGDAFVEPGETATVAVPVTNRGDGRATSVSVQLTTTTPGVTITPAVRNYGTVEPGQTKTAAPFTIRVAASVPVATAIELRARVSFVGAYSPQVDTLRIVVGEPSSTVTDVAYTGPAVPIPDSDPAGATVPLTVSGVGPLSAVTFSVDGTECTTTEGATTVGIDHTFVSDIAGTLTAPDGTTVTLFDRFDGSGNNLCQAVFDDSATRSIQTALSTEAPFTGSWQPAEPLSSLLGRNADGTWQFTVVDNATADVGSIRAVSLHVSGYVTG